MMKPLPFLPSQSGFLGLEQDTPASLAACDAVVIPFGLEASVSYGGNTQHGPQAIIDASHQVELFDEALWCEPCQFIQTGTLVPPTIATPLPNALEQLEFLTDAVLEAGKFPLILGGEHALTAGSIRAVTKHHPDVVLLHFDAHADLRDGYEGEHYSHAAALRRCLDNPAVTLVSLGIRNISSEEIPFLEANRKRIHIHWAKDKAQWDLSAILAPLRNKPVYITFDLDGFDASLMPATGTPEPGGLFWDDVMPVIAGAAKVAKKIVGADIVELAPIAGLHACDFTAAKLAYRILTHALIKQLPPPPPQ